MMGLRRISRWSLGTAVMLASGAMLGMSVPASATTFEGKQMRLLIGASAGGGYDTFARTIANHWPRHIPGNPSMVAQNMPGPMSLPVANHIYSVAPKDGTVIGAVNPQIASQAILDPERARFDARQFVWVGSALREVQVMVARSDAEVTTFRDAFEKELIVGGSGGATNTFPTLVNAVLGTKFRIVMGYPGTREVNMAMERGEVQANGAITWASIKATMGDMLANNQITLVAQYGINKHPELPHVEHVLPYAKTDADRDALMVLFATQEFGRPYVAPPGLPAEVARVLQESFMATMNDEAFLTQARERRLDIDPTPGEEIQTLVAQLYASSPETIERVRAIFAN